MNKPGLAPSAFSLEHEVVKGKEQDSAKGEGDERDPDQKDSENGSKDDEDHLENQIMNEEAEGEETNNGSSTTMGSDDTDQVDKILGERLTQLSLEQRTQGIHELHGVADTIEDLPQWEIDRNVQQITRIICTQYKCNDGDDEDEHTLLHMSNNDDDQTTSSDASATSCAYHKAMKINSRYVEKIQLLCLKADYYDVNKAAERCVSFFAYKQELFGCDGDILGRDITLQDLDESDLDALKNNGAAQLLPERDRAGRGIILIQPPKLVECSFQTCFRVLFYVTMAALQDEQIQKHGAALVLWALGQTKIFKGRPSKFARSLWFLPVRVVAVHFCYDTEVMHRATKIMSRAMDTHHLCRFRNHMGTYQDCVLSLMTFGIPKQALPINMESGKIDLQAHRQWIRMMQTQEASSSSSSPIPSDTTAISSAVSAVIPDWSTSGDQLNLASMDEDIRRRSSNNSVTSQRVDVDVASTFIATNISTGIIIPGPMDIMMGRGSHSRKSQGNIRFRMILKEYYDKYNSASRNARMNVACQVLAQLKSHGCRFIKIANNTSDTASAGDSNKGHMLQECDSDESIEKISHAFRNMRTAKRNQKEGRKTKDKSTKDGSAMFQSADGTSRKRRSSATDIPDQFDRHFIDPQLLPAIPLSSHIFSSQQEQRPQEESDESYATQHPSSSRQSSSSIDDFLMF